MVSENIHSHPEENRWKFQGGVGSQKPKFLKESMKQTGISRGVGCLNHKNRLVGGFWIFYGTTHSLEIDVPIS